MLVAFAPADGFLLALGAMVIVGVMNSMANGPLGALTQTIIRKDMQGRVNGLVSSVATAMAPLGLMIAGPVSDLIGIRSWYWIAGLITLIMGLTGFFIPAIMNVEDIHDPETIEIQSVAPAME
jgi:DHA3 family macrolide efflux protein-like MFS transporter